MATVIPCIKGKLGNTVYYEATMPVRELVTAVRPASELDEWSGMGVEDRMQRLPNVKRIEKELAPYIADTQDRFFGSIIVLVYKGEIHYEALQEMTKLPRAYQTILKNVGFLTIDGGSLIVLDGQHRLIALEKVLKGEILGEYSEEVPNDDISVIFLPHETAEKTRRIFNKVNRYAKSTSRADNIITSEDDAHAIVARKLLAEGAVLDSARKKSDEGLVNWKSNTLTARSTSLTTMSVVYETVKLILKSEDIVINEHTRPSEFDIDEYCQLAERYWRTVIEGIPPYREAVSNPSKIPALRADDKPCALLFKPAAQQALFKALTLAHKKYDLDLQEAVARAARIDWEIKSDIWKDIIVRKNGTIDPKEVARDRAASLITYLVAADKMTEEDIFEVKSLFNQARGHSDLREELPAPVLEHSGL